MKLSSLIVGLKLQVSSLLTLCCVSFEVRMSMYSHIKAMVFWVVPLYILYQWIPTFHQ